MVVIRDALWLALLHATLRNCEGVSVQADAPHREEAAIEVTADASMSPMRKMVRRSSLLDWEASERRVSTTLEWYQGNTCPSANLSVSIFIPPGSSLKSDNCLPLSAKFEAAYPHPLLGVGQHQLYMKAFCDGNAMAGGSAKLCLFYGADDRTCRFSVPDCLVVSATVAKELAHGSCQPGLLEPGGLEMGATMVNYEDNLAMPDCLIPSISSASLTLFIIIGIASGCWMLCCLWLMCCCFLPRATWLVEWIGSWCGSADDEPPKMMMPPGKGGFGPPPQFAMKGKW